MKNPTRVGAHAGQLGTQGAPMYNSSLPRVRKGEKMSLRRIPRRTCSCLPPCCSQRYSLRRRRKTPAL